jgi:hypothetical protein
MDHSTAGGILFNREISLSARDTDNTPNRQIGSPAADNAGLEQILKNMSSSLLGDRTAPALQNGPSPVSQSVGPASRGASALSSRITSVLSASYADLEIRDAVDTLDARGVRNTAETRRQIRLDVQKEVIQCNGEIVKDFGEVAEVCKPQPRCVLVD